MCVRKWGGRYWKYVRNGWMCEVRAWVWWGWVYVQVGWWAGVVSGTVGVFRVLRRASMHALVMCECIDGQV
jgi:roadblock/LC7 domain-containing protein